MTSTPPFPPHFTAPLPLAIADDTTSVTHSGASPHRTSSSLTPQVSVTQMPRSRHPVSRVRDDAAVAAGETAAAATAWSSLQRSSSHPVDAIFSARAPVLPPSPPPPQPQRLLPAPHLGVVKNDAQGGSLWPHQLPCALPTSGDNLFSSEDVCDSHTPLVAASRTGGATTTASSTRDSCSVSAAVAAGRAGTPFTLGVSSSLFATTAALTEMHSECGGGLKTSQPSSPPLPPQAYRRRGGSNSSNPNDCRMTTPMTTMTAITTTTTTTTSSSSSSHRHRCCSSSMRGADANSRFDDNNDVRLVCTSEMEWTQASLSNVVSDRREEEEEERLASPFSPAQLCAGAGEDGKGRWILRTATRGDTVRVAHAFNEFHKAHLRLERAVQPLTSLPLQRSLEAASAAGVEERAAAAMLWAAEQMASL